MAMSNSASHGHWLGQASWTPTAPAIAILEAIVEAGYVAQWELRIAQGGSNEPEAHAEACRLVCAEVLTRGSSSELQELSLPGVHELVGVRPRGRYRLTFTIARDGTVSSALHAFDDSSERLDPVGIHEGVRRVVAVRILKDLEG